MDSEQIDISEGFHETFRIHIIWRMAITTFLFVILVACAIGALGSSVNLLVMYLLGFSSGIEIHKSFFGIRFLLASGSSTLVLLFCCYSMFILVLSVVATWKTGIEISKNGIKYRGSVILWERLVPWRAFQTRSIPWEEVVRVRRPGGDELSLSILVEHYPSIEVSLFADKRRMAELIELMLGKLERRYSPEERPKGTERVFRVVIPLVVIAAVPVLIGMYVIFLNRLEEERSRRAGLVFTRIYTQQLDGTIDTFRHRLNVGDNNGDGKLDLFLSSRDVYERSYDPEQRKWVSAEPYFFPCFVYEQKKGTFVRVPLKTGLPEAEESQILAIADVDGDSRADILLRVSPEDVVLLEWNGDEFAEAWRGTMPRRFLSKRGSVVAVDMDNDGCDEIVLAGIDRSLNERFSMVVLKWGAGQLAKEYAVETNFWGYSCHLTAGDLDQDGTNEVYLGSSDHEGTIDIIGIFTPFGGALRAEVVYLSPDFPPYPFYEMMLGVADVDHDGQEGIVMCGYVPEYFRYMLVSVRLVDGRWEHEPTYVEFERGYHVGYAGDLYGTGRDVILTISEKGLLSVYSLEE